jgi:hypothetical protein
MHIQPYTKDLEPAVKAFNQRLRAGGEAYWSFPESHVPNQPERQGGHPYQELFVVVDGNEIRGGYQLTHQRFVLQGETMPVSSGPEISVSEGIVNRRYGMIGAVQARDALERQPLLYAVGAITEPLVKLLAAMRWTLFTVPLYFRVLSASNFLANSTYLRHRRSMRIALHLLRGSGLGTIGIRGAQLRLPPLIRGPREARAAQLVNQFGPWADKLWESCKREYSFIGARDSDTLNALYPPSDRRFLRLRVSRGVEDLGWVVMLDKQMLENKYFGNMRVGSIVDCLAAPEHTYVAIRCATRFLESRGVDIIVSNQSSSAWRKAFFCAGFLRGPSNFILALSPMLAEKLRPLQTSKPRMHVTRRDSDGLGDLL